MIKLNCDIGESFGIWQLNDDSKIMPLIDMANIACGFHASDPLNIQKSIELAKRFNIKIGAHPSYPDLVGFGRRTIKCSLEEIKAIFIYQIGALRAIANKNGTDISYVKPHGALYNDMMNNIEIFEALVSALREYDKSLKLMVLSSNKNKKLKDIAKDIELIFEVFADRNYTDDGFLVPRGKKDAVITDISLVIKRVKDILNNQIIYSINNRALKLSADTICVHGDNQEALNLVKAIKEVLDNEN